MVPPLLYTSDSSGKQHQHLGSTSGAVVLPFLQSFLRGMRSGADWLALGGGTGVSVGGAEGGGVVAALVLSCTGDGARKSSRTRTPGGGEGVARFDCTDMQCGICSAGGRGSGTDRKGGATAERRGGAEAE